MLDSSSSISRDLEKCSLNTHAEAKAVNAEVQRVMKNTKADVLFL